MKTITLKVDGYVATELAVIRNALQAGWVRNGETKIAEINAGISDEALLIAGLTFYRKHLEDEERHIAANALTQSYNDTEL